MKIFTGFSFTEEPISHLKERGFSFQTDMRKQKNGYQSFFATFKNQSAFEIREILEEEEYLKFSAIKSFKPLSLTSETEMPFVAHANTVSELKQCVTADSIPELGEMKKYFQIRKTSPLWALWLECGDFSTFTKYARPDQVFEWDGQQTALIHLGPNCFDLLVTQK